MKNKLIFVALFLVVFSFEAFAYDVSIGWVFDKPNFDVELYHCTDEVCGSFDSRVINTFSGSNVYNMFYSAEGTQRHAAFFYEACFRPDGFVVTTFGDFSTVVNEAFVKKDQCRSELQALALSKSQPVKGETITVSSNAGSAFTVSDDAPGSPKFYPDSHRDFFTSDVKARLYVDDSFVTEKLLSLYQDTAQDFAFSLDTSGLGVGLHTVKVVTDPVDCICDQGNKVLVERTAQIEVKSPVQNTPPVLEGIPDKTIKEDSGLNKDLVDLWQFARDNETPVSQLTFVITSQSNTSVVECVIRENRFVDCTTKQDKNGFSEVTVEVTDPEGLFDDDTFKVIVLPVNDAPKVGDIPDQTIDSCEEFDDDDDEHDDDREFEEFDLDDFVTDVDNTPQEITWRASGNVELDVDINPVTHIVIVTAPECFIGSETVRFTATDPGNLSDFDDATFTVEECDNENNPPLISGIPDKTLEENSGLNMDVVEDLRDFAEDDETPDDELLFTITNQSDEDVVSCIIRSNTHIDCTTKQDEVGFSEVTVRVTDEEGLFDEDTFKVKVEEEEDDDNGDDDEDDDNGDDDEDDDNGDDGGSNIVSGCAQISKVVYDEKVKSGGFLHMNIYSSCNLKDEKAKITIDELGIMEEFGKLTNIDIKIPESTEQGVYTARVELENRDRRGIVYKQFLVVGEPASGASSQDAQKNVYMELSGGVVKSVTTETDNKGESSSLLLVTGLVLTVVLILVLLVVAVKLTTRR